MKKRKSVGEENRPQLQAVSFSTQEDETISSLKKSHIDSYDELESYKRLRKRRIKIAIYRMLIWCFVVAFIPFVVFWAMVIVNPGDGHEFFGLTFYIVISNSMEPEIKVNDCIAVRALKPGEELKVGDDITFVRESDRKTVTHRILAITEDENGDVAFITKGVNNITADSEIVPYRNVTGKRVATLAVLGQVIMFFRTGYGLITFIALFVVIMTLIVTSFRISDDIRAVGK